MSTERAKPFVAWMHSPEGEWPKTGTALIYEAQDEDPDLVPVVVTPLLPDDPRPGETWLWLSYGSEEEVTVVGAPNGDQIPVLTGGGMLSVMRHNLRRPPALKTFRINVAKAGLQAMMGPQIKAESREEAVRKLADALEEVT